MSQYRRLTQADRHRIEASHREGRRQVEIAQNLGCSPATISRELWRNGGACGYRSLSAQKQADLRRLRCRRKRVIGGQLAGEFHLSLRQGLSPELFSGRWRFKRRRAPSTSTFYRYAHASGWSRRLLPRSGCRGAGRYIQRQRPDWMQSIAQRPTRVNSRSRFGDWERDTLYGAEGRLALVLIERKSRYVLIAPLKKRTAKETTRLTNWLLSQSSLPKLTMTNDNGREFSDGLNLKLPVYYCDPGKPHQRGAVENVNRMLRRYIPRSANLDAYSRQDFRRIQNAINNRPRKCLGFRTAAEVMRAQKLR